MMQKQSYLLKTILNLSIIVIVFLVSCSKKKIGPQFNDEGILAGDNFYILNEGNFGFSNATLTAYNPYTKEVKQNAFVTKNGFALGDVGQSLFFHKGDVFIVMNNSGKIVVADSADLTYKYDITGVQSPRYLHFYQNQVYISDLNSNFISVYNLQTKQIQFQIPVYGWVEEFTQIGDKLYFFSRGNYLSNQGDNKVYAYDLLQNKLTDSITVALEPNSMAVDKNNNLWVLCSGGINEEIAKLQKISINGLSVVKSFNFSNLSESPSRLVIDNSGDNLYYINKDVFKINIWSDELPVNSYIPANGRNFYGLSISHNNEIYVTNAIDYQQQGEVYHYYENGQLINSFKTGIIPQAIAF